MAVKKVRKPLIAYKGFSSEMTCNGFQYEEGKEYDIGDNDIKLCERGFHACFNPSECLTYYEEYNFSKYHKVELSGFIDTTDASSKVCASHIKILEELSVEDLIYLQCYIDIERKLIGTVTCKDDIERLLSKGFNLGNRITIIDGIYNHNWVCVDIKEDNSYIFMMDTPIISSLDDRDGIKRFEDTRFNNEILLPLGETLKTVLESHIKLMKFNNWEVNSNNRVVKNGIHRTLITLPSYYDIFSHKNSFKYIRACIKNKVVPFSGDYTSNYSGNWFRSIISPSAFDSNDFENTSHSSIAYKVYNCRPIINIG